MPPLQETVNRKNRDEGWHTHTAGICVFLSHSALPRYYRHRAQRHKQNTSVCTGISFTCQPKCSSDCQLQNTGQPTDTYKHTPRHAHTHTHIRSHTTAFQQSFGSPKVSSPTFLHSSRHNSSQNFLCQSRA